MSALGCILAAAKVELTMKLSVDHQEINCYIRCRNPSDNADQLSTWLHVDYLTFPFLMTVLQSFVRHPFCQYNALY